MWKHDKLDDVQIALLDQNIISIGGEIDSINALYVREALLRLMGKGSPPICFNTSYFYHGDGFGRSPGFS